MTGEPAVGDRVHYVPNRQASSLNRSTLICWAADVLEVLGHCTNDQGGDEHAPNVLLLVHPPTRDSSRRFDVEHHDGYLRPAGTWHEKTGCTGHRPVEDSEPRDATPAAPLTATICWTPGQNAGAVSMLQGRVGLFAIIGSLAAGETVEQVAHEFGCPVEAVRVLEQLRGEIADGTFTTADRGPGSLDRLAYNDDGHEHPDDVDELVHTGTSHLEMLDDQSAYLQVTRSGTDEFTQLEIAAVRDKPRGKPRLAITCSHDSLALADTPAGRRQNGDPT